MADLQKIYNNFADCFSYKLFGGIIPYAIGLDDPYMPAISSFLASVIVELRYFPALYLLLEGEEEIS